MAHGTAAPAVWAAPLAESSGLERCESAFRISQALENQPDIAWAAGDSRPGYIRLVLQGLRDSEGRFTPLETTTFSEWGGQDRRSRRAVGNGERVGSRLALPIEGKASSNQLLASLDALLPTEENIKFVVLKPSMIPPGFCLP